MQCRRTEVPPSMPRRAPADTSGPGHASATAASLLSANPQSCSGPGCRAGADRGTKQPVGTFPCLPSCGGTGVNCGYSFVEAASPPGYNPNVEPIKGAAPERSLFRRLVGLPPTARTPVLCLSGSESMLDCTRQPSIHESVRQNSIAPWAARHPVARGCVQQALAY